MFVSPCAALSTAGSSKSPRLATLPGSPPACRPPSLPLAHPRPASTLRPPSPSLARPTLLPARSRPASTPRPPSLVAEFRSQTNISRSASTSATAIAREASSSAQADSQALPSSSKLDDGEGSAPKPELLTLVGAGASPSLSTLKAMGLDDATASRIHDEARGRRHDDQPLRAVRDHGPPKVLKQSMVQNAG